MDHATFLTTVKSRLSAMDREGSIALAGGEERMRYTDRDWDPESHTVSYGGYCIQPVTARDEGFRVYWYTQAVYAFPEAGGNPQDVDVLGGASPDKYMALLVSELSGTKRVGFQARDNEVDTVYGSLDLVHEGDSVEDALEAVMSLLIKRRLNALTQRLDTRSNQGLFSLLVHREIPLLWRLEPGYPPLNRQRRTGQGRTLLYTASSNTEIEHQTDHQQLTAHRVLSRAFPDFLGNRQTKCFHLLHHPYYCFITRKLINLLITF